MPFSRLLLRLVFLVAAARLHAQQQDTLRLIFAGDIMNNQAMIDAACVVKNKKYDYAPCFRYVRPLLESADIAFGNLELTMPGEPPYTGFPHFRSPDAMADALKSAGFDVLVTANNHANDSGGRGVRNTIEVLKKRKFQQTGTFTSAADREARYPLLLEKKGFRIALLNYTHHTNGIATPKPVVVNRISSRQIAADMAGAQALRPDFVIVFLHWGEEFELRENASQRRLAKYLIRHGADLVIGAHPHVVQPIRRETAVGEASGRPREALVAYSLGNFISNMRPPHADGGILLRVNLVKKRGAKTPGAARILDHGYLPVWRYIQKPKKGKAAYFILPVAKLERNPDWVPGLSAPSRARMGAYAGGLRKRLSAPEKKY